MPASQTLRTGANTAVLMGGFFLKAPQLLKVRSSRSVKGISEVSLLFEVRLNGVTIIVVYCSDGLQVQCGASRCNYVESCKAHDICRLGRL